MASRTASEIWSDTLSGCPSDTDSEVNRKSLFIGSPHSRSARHFIKDRAPQAGPNVKLLLRPLAPPATRRQPFRGRLPRTARVPAVAALPRPGDREPDPERAL